MIGFLKGKIAFLNSNSCILETGGIGFNLIISLQTYLKIKDKEEAALWTYVQIKDENLNLYGFYNEEERDYFLKLISIPGIGPKTAVQVLSHYPLLDLKEAISEGNVKKISKIPNIGKKTAERLILEMRGFIPSEKKEGYEIEELGVNAFINLGYSQKTAVEVVEKVLKEKNVQGIEDLILEGLKLLGK